MPDYTILQWIAVGAFPALLLAAGASDIAAMRIPNLLTGVIALAFPVAAAGTAMPYEALLWHMGAGLAALVIGMGIFALGWAGGGDAKLFAASVLWLGPEAAPAYALMAALFGGGLTLGLLAFRRLPLPAPLAGQGWLMRLHDPQEGVPYGVALALGALAVFPQSIWMAGAA